MKITGYRCFTIIAGLTIGAPLAAADLALVLANRNYENAPYLRASSRAPDMIDALERANFRVFSSLDQNSQNMQARVAEFAREVSGEGDGEVDRIVIVLSGHMVGNGQGNWILARDAHRPNAFDVGTMGVSLQALADLAALSPAQAVMMIGTTDSSIITGAGLEAGVGDLVAPQGVQIAMGDFYAMPTMLRNGYLKEGATLADVARMAPDNVQVTGFISDAIGLLAANSGEDTGDAPSQEYAYWDVVTQLNTTEAYQYFLNRFPSGAYADQARQRLGLNDVDPQVRAEQAEAALGLSRTARRQIQRNLAVLGFDPRGVDGIFGRGSRAAIASWQQTVGFEATGYLSGNQVNRLQTMATQRSQELEREAQAQREQQQRQDNSYWHQTGSSGQESGLRAYLQRYPDGIHAREARAGLQGIANQREEDQQREAVRRDRNYWRQTGANGEESGLRAYLQRYPNGIHANEARAGLEAFANQQAENQQREARRRDRNYWNQTGANGDESGLRAYLQRYPNGLHAQEARIALRAIDRDRAAEQEREAQLQREQQRHQDNAYWRQTGRSGEEAGLRAYLQRYPDGVHAQDAREQLHAIVQQRNDEAQQAERQRWNAARAANTIAALRAFLNQHPQGRFAGDANSMLNALQAAERAGSQGDRDRAEEAVITGSPGQALMIEQMLAVFGVDPGPQDGRFDRATRNAIRKYQRLQGLPATGFVSKETMLRLFPKDR